MSQVDFGTNIKIPKNITSNLATFGAIVSGVIVGVLASLSMMSSAIKEQVAAATESTGHTVAMVPVATTTGTCSVPTLVSNQASLGGGAGAGQVAAVAPAGGRGGDSSGGNTWVRNFVGGVFATNTATISNTGSGSMNVAKTTNQNTTTVKNNNHVNVVNDNPQTASSGNASTENNTSAGNTESGLASNTSRSEYDVTITN